MRRTLISDEHLWHHSLSELTEQVGNLRVAWVGYCYGNWGTTVGTRRTLCMLKWEQETSVVQQGFLEKEDAFHTNKLEIL